MFTLLMKICVGATICYYTVPPLSYDSLSICQQQAGLIAGLRAGQHPPGEDVVMAYRCAAQGQDRAAKSEWFEVSLLSKTRG
ncbi:MAG: hypothetical protein Kilf2KO_40350 [Rhodospirillales bacterium]